MILELLRHAGFVFILLLIVLSLLHFATGKIKGEASYAFSFIIGILILFSVITVYSIYYTKFITVYTLSLPILGIIFYRLSKHDHFKNTWVNYVKEFPVLIGSIFLATTTVYIIQHRATFIPLS